MVVFYQNKKIVQLRSFFIINKIIT